MTDSICKTLQDGNFTGLKFKSPDFELLIDRDYILLREIIIESKSETLKIPNDKPYITKPVKINFEIHKNKPDFEFFNNKNIAYFDNDKLEYPLVIRKWQRGDRLIPFGMTGSKLVSDILIDNKVDSFSKDQVYVILSGNKIIWLVGYRSSQEFKVDKDSKNIMLMQFLSGHSGFDLELFKDSDT